MDCKHIEEKLPAYLEGALPPEEVKLVEGHLVACPNCRLALEHLVKAGKLVRELDEAEPPPWLKQRIMERVREERERREGFLRRLFYPLHIKLPATALATVMIAVFAVYIFRAVEPETRYLHQTPSEPTTAAPEKSVTKPPEAIPPKVTVPEVRSEKSRIAVSEADRESGGRRILSEEKEALPKPAEQALAERKISERRQAARGVATGAEEQQATAAKRALPPAKKEEVLYGAAMKDEVQAPAVPAKIRAAATVRPGDVFSLYVRDPAAVMSDVERVLVESGARKVTREFRDGTGIVTAEIEVGKKKEIFEKLKSLGDVKETRKAPEPPAGPVAIKIEVFAGP
ncbi:MAG: putative rane protein [Deltaproteobacteria bacterium]|jgi:bifunctional DNA-binding transcriptional regulator/antitoxin component of YhaV-PrlF toxin-antitoxin module|nr:putative rane protein [Deltaproteobacteria bacterium]